ncbi:hypothetical protein [Streptomyces sp. NPDC059071]|uniref:hypothetical protein n=1 Tax=unclassified Streptomyces TaxID=2593676 RepID=UPI003659FE60
MTQAWSIYVELGRRDAPDDLYEDLYEHLAAAAPSVGTAPNGNLSARVLVEASTARQAIDTGLKTVTAAAKNLGITEPVVGVEAITEEELDRRNADPAVPPLVGVSEIAELLGVTRGRAGQLTKLDDFPPAVATLKSGPVFVREQVEAFGRNWDRRGGRPLKPVHLTGLERDLLATLRVARNALVHGQPVDRDHVRALVDSVEEWAELWDRLLAVHASAPSGDKPEAVRIEFEATGEVDAALDVLRRDRLIEFDVVEGEGQIAAHVQLTPRGVRAPIA